MCMFCLKYGHLRDYFRSEEARTDDVKASQMYFDSHEQRNDVIANALTMGVDEKVILEKLGIDHDPEDDFEKLPDWYNSCRIASVKIFLLAAATNAAKAAGLDWRKDESIIFGISVVYARMPRDQRETINRILGNDDEQTFGRISW